MTLRGHTGIVLSYNRTLVHPFSATRTCVRTDVPASTELVCESVGSSAYLFDGSDVSIEAPWQTNEAKRSTDLFVANLPACRILDQPRVGALGNRSLWVDGVEEKLGNGEIVRDVWQRVGDDLRHVGC